MDTYLLAQRIPSHTTQYLATAAATMGALAFGTTIGYTSPAGPYLLANSSSLTITQEELNWVSSSPCLGGLAGSLAGGVAINYLGRRGATLASTLPFVLGWMLIVLAKNFSMLLCGRLLTGLGLGVVCVAVPTFIGEIASADIRGLLGSSFQLMVTSGILLVYALGIAVTSWRWLAGLCIMPPVLTFVFLLCLRETPTYLLSRGREVEAAKSLQFYRGRHYDISQELDALRTSLLESPRARASWSILLHRANLYPLLISIGVFLFTQLSGINAVLAYMSSLFQESGSSLPDDINSVITGVVMVAATVVGSVLMDRLGRKVLLITSAALMAVSLIVLGEYYAGRDAGSSWVSGLGWIPLACLILYITAFSLGFGPIPWLLLGELFSPEVKEVAASIVTIVNWSTAFIVTLLFAPMQEALGNSHMYLVLSGVCIAALVFSSFVIPETKGKTLQEIRDHFEGTRVNQRTSLET